MLSIAEADGHQLHAIGVTWSQDADLEAALVLDSLADVGFDNVVAVQLPQAAEALARSIGRVIGYERTAVCVVEHNAVVLSLVDTFGGEVETLVNRAIGDGDLLDWVSSVFDRDDWRPEGLFVVGSVGGLDALAAWLEHGLGCRCSIRPRPNWRWPTARPWPRRTVPRSNSARPTAIPTSRPRRIAAARWWRPVAMLAGGAVTFVVAAALAISPHFLPARDAVPPHTPRFRPTSRCRPRRRHAAPALPVAVEPPAAVEPPVAVEPPAVQSPPEAPPDAGIEEAPEYQPAPPAEAVSPGRGTADAVPADPPARATARGDRAAGRGAAGPHATAAVA